MDLVPVLTELEPPPPAEEFSGVSPDQSRVRSSEFTVHADFAVSPMAAKPFRVFSVGAEIDGKERHTDVPGIVCPRKEAERVES